METVAAVEVVQVVVLTRSDGQHAPWDSTAKGTNSGVMMIDGAWKMLCNKGCGWNETHTTKFHDEHQRSAATFKVPPSHPYLLDRLEQTKSAESYEKAMTGQKPLTAKQLYSDRWQYVKANNMMARLSQIQQRRVVGAMSA